MATKLTLVLTPFIALGFGEKAKTYLKACIRDSLGRDEIPLNTESLVFLSGALYESDGEQQSEAQELAKSMVLRADMIAFYVDKGSSEQMREIHRFAVMMGKTVVSRYVYGR